MKKTAEKLKIKSRKTNLKTLKPKNKFFKKIKPTYSNGAKYALNMNFRYIDELRDLVLKSSPEDKQKISEKLSKLGRVKLAVITGSLLNRVNPNATETDLFIVGDDIDRIKFRALLRSIEADVGSEVRYVMMEKEEFQYRLKMFDRFIRVLLEGPHEKLIDKIGL